MDEYEEKQRRMIEKAGELLNFSMQKSKENEAGAIALGKQLKQIEDNQKRIMEKLEIVI